MNRLVWRKSSRSGTNGGACVEVAWRKSSRSHGNGGNCVEVAWHKSSHSGDNGGNCIEVAATAPAVLIRDSKLTSSPLCPILTVDRDTWAGFLSQLS